jgi:uncharacterized protein
MLNYAQEHGYRFILDGTNADDKNDYRPGRQAAMEKGLRSEQALVITQAEMNI